MSTPWLRILAGMLCVGALVASTAIRAVETQFTIAVIPDTQNYIDYKQQRAAGFPFDAADLFLEQMTYLAANARSQGGNIVFATSVGDVWQHSSLEMDPDHVARGFKRVPNPIFRLGPSRSRPRFEATRSSPASCRSPSYPAITTTMPCGQTRSIRPSLRVQAHALSA
jgi:hypothetical protein